MQITVEFFAQTREAIGRSRISLQLADGITLHELLHQLAGDYPKLRRWLVDESGNLSQSLSIAIDGQQIAMHENRILNDREEIWLIPAVSGGSSE